MPSSPPLTHLKWLLPLIPLLLTGAGQELSVAVSQRDRSFKPGKIDLAVGETLHIVNDDGELIHHVYVKADDFNFDSGEQDPGTSVDIRFDHPTRYVLLCAIHPKMRLEVTVH